MKNDRKEILCMIKNKLDQLSFKDRFLIIDSLNRYFYFKNQQVRFQKAIRKE